MTWTSESFSTGGQLEAECRRYFQQAGGRAASAADVIRELVKLGWDLEIGRSGWGFTLAPPRDGHPQLCYRYHADDAVQSNLGALDTPPSRRRAHLSIRGGNTPAGRLSAWIGWCYRGGQLHAALPEPRETTWDVSRPADQVVRQILNRLEPVLHEIAEIVRVAEQEDDARERDMAATVEALQELGFDVRDNGAGPYAAATTPAGTYISGHVQPGNLHVPHLTLTVEDLRALLARG